MIFGDLLCLIILRQNQRSFELIMLNFIFLLKYLKPGLENFWRASSERSLIHANKAATESFIAVKIIPLGTSHL
jgi:hypothetical protein